MNLSFIIPSYNNIKHLKNVYSSIKRHANECEIIFLDDGSTDETWEWLQSIKNENIKLYKSETRVGHTVLYDVGINLASNEIVGILHADMIVGPNYVKNILKHLKRGSVVCGTRIEPPLHPSGKEKIIENFGIDFDDLNIKKFESFCLEQQLKNKDQITKGMFAPWVIYKSDFLSIGGHDHVFAPFPYEDSDIFQRWILNGYELIQSRDAFVYHLTCRGHRWTQKIQKDDDFYKKCVYKNTRNFIRKWQSWIKNDEYSYPIIKNKYNIGFVIKNCSLDILQYVEPWCSTVYSDCKEYQNYIEKNQKDTCVNLQSKLQHINSTKTNDIIIEFDARMLNNDRFNFITDQLSDILTDSGELGEMEFDIFKFNIKSLKTYQKDLIKVTN